jgi:hypothetical protein
VKACRLGAYFFLVFGLVACNSISSSRLKPTEIPRLAPIDTPASIPTATNTPIPLPTATAASPNTPVLIPIAVPTQPAFTPTPTLPAVPPGMGALILFNHYNTQLNFDIASKLYKIESNNSLVIFLAPGKHTYSATIPGFTGKTGVVEIQESFYRVQEWGP